MKPIILFLLVFFAAAFTALGQKPEPAKVVTPPAAAQQEIAELQRQASEANLVLEAAKARLEVAEQRVVTAVIKAMAESGCAPSRCTPKQDKDGNVLFEPKLPDPQPSPPPPTPK